MNIFVLDYNPRKAAEMLCDKHIPKMLVEAAQMLSTAHVVLDGKGAIGAYKQAYPNHPCTVWARDSEANYRWLWLHGMEIARQYTLRFGKRHKTTRVMMALKKPPRNFAYNAFTPFALAMPDQYKRDDTVMAYRLYYAMEKARFAEYRQPASVPGWLSIALKAREISSFPALFKS